MIIREANENDIMEISKLYIENWQKTYSGIFSQSYLDGLTIDYVVDKWEKYMLKKEQIIFVAYEEEAFLGFAAAKVDDDEANCWYLDSLHIAKCYRGKGTGTSLINTVGKYAFDNGYEGMSICIIKGNDNAKALYEKLGATHYKDFIDDFNGTKSKSEKLIWNDLSIFANIN